MPPKDSESLLDNVYFGVSTGDGGYEYKPVGKVEHVVDIEPVDIPVTCSIIPRLCLEKNGYLSKLGRVAAAEMIWRGNDLYLRFPKKGRRKLKKFKRCKRLNAIRIKKWGRMTFGVSMD